MIQSKFKVMSQAIYRRTSSMASEKTHIEQPMVGKKKNPKSHRTGGETWRRHHHGNQIKCYARHGSHFKNWNSLAFLLLLFLSLPLHTPRVFSFLCVRLRGRAQRANEWSCAHAHALDHNWVTLTRQTTMATQLQSTFWCMSFTAVLVSKPYASWNFPTSDTKAGERAREREKKKEVLS